MNNLIIIPVPHQHMTDLFKELDGPPLGLKVKPTGKCRKSSFFLMASRVLQIDVKNVKEDNDSQ